MFRCCSLETSHPRPLPQSPKVCSVHLCLFFCFAYRVIITIFLNSIYMCWYTVMVFIFLAYFTKIWNASRICMSSLRRGHANLCIVPILVYVLSKRALKHTFNWNLKQLILFWYRQSQLTWLIHKWVTDPFLPSMGVFCGWEVMLTLLKAEIGDRVLAERKKALAHGPLLMFEMSKIPKFTCHPYNSSLALNAATLSAHLNTVIILPWRERISSPSGWNHHTSKQVLWPILCLKCVASGDFF